MTLEGLASYKRFKAHLDKNWPAFSSKRNERLRQQGRFGGASERVAENIVEDLFTTAIDWQLGDINNQVGYTDILVSHGIIKRCIVEVKRPGALAWNQSAVLSALSQARRYADEQKVKCIAVSDGFTFYAADIERGGLSDRVFVSLDSEIAPLDLWWLSVDGIYRPRAEPDGKAPVLLPPQTKEKEGSSKTGQGLLRPKYSLPCECFAYVGGAREVPLRHAVISRIVPAYDLSAGDGNSYRT